MTSDRKVTQTGFARLGAIDATRGVGALVVVLSHICTVNQRRDSPVRTILSLPFEFGYLGVPLFLVVSGFCIHLRRASALDVSARFATDWRAFWRRRIVRLYPAYAVAATLSAIAYYLTSAPVRAIWFPIVSLYRDALTHFLLIHNLFPDYSSGLGNGAFWTIGLEEQLYFLYPLFLLCRRRASAARIAQITAALAVIYTLIVINFAPDRFGPPRFQLGNMVQWVPRYWFLWILGAMMIEALAASRPLPEWTRARSAMVVASAIGLATSPLTLGRVLASHWGRSFHIAFIGNVTALSDIWLSMACFILVNRSVAQEIAVEDGWWSNQRLQQCGRMSYSLYLIHLPVINLLETVCRFPMSPVFVVIRYVFYVPVCIVVAAGFFQAVERHFVRPSGLLFLPDSRPVWK